MGATEERERFGCAVARFDEANSKDPNVEIVAGECVPRELLYARRLSEWVLRLDPAASEALRLAARCQHIRRWEVPRSSFPPGRAGYHSWKNHLKEFHAAVAGSILRECGYSEEMIQRVQRLNRKAGFPEDPESRTMEDALCLVFLEHQLGPLAEKTEREKTVNALRKSWAKMTPAARQFAFRLKLEPQEAALLEQALSPENRGGA